MTVKYHSVNSIVTYCRAIMKVLTQYHKDVIVIILSYMVPPPLSRRRPVAAIPGKGVRCQWGQFGMRASPYDPPNIDHTLFYQFLSLCIKNLCFEGILKYIFKYLLMAASTMKIMT